MKKRILSIVITLCMVLLLVPTTAFAETVTDTNNADKFSWDNATVYYLMIDRFKNGDTTNDHSYGRGLDQNGDVIKGVDGRGTFHGGDFAGVTQTIEEGYFDTLGVNALCISAAYEQIHGYVVGDDGSPSFAHYSYHGNYVLDYTETDANFGTVEEFQTLVDTAHEHGLRVVMNVVMNHAGYNTLYDMNEYGFGTLKTGWDNYYYSMSDVKNEYYNNYIDYTGNATDWSEWWGSAWVRASLPEYTNPGSDNYTMSYCGLPDFKTESTKSVNIPEFLKTKWMKEGTYNEKNNNLNTYFENHGYSKTVTNYISYWLSSWVREYGIDGFRCDTAEYVDLSSWKTLKTMCTEALREWKNANPDKALDDLDFWMTGECRGHGVDYDDYYTQGGFDSMINSDTAGGEVLSLGNVAGKYNDYANDINTVDNFNVLSCMSSDDTTLARGDQKYLGSALLLLPGGVQIYYGDETNRPLVSGVNFDGNGGAGHSLRSDMNWDTKDEDVLSHWQKVGTFRNNHIAIGAGSNTSVDATSGIGFVRTYSKGTVTDRVAVCIGASAFTDVTMDVSSAWNIGDKVVNYYDGSSAVVASDGTVTFSSGANGTILIGETASEDIGEGSNIDTTAPTGEITAPTTFTVNSKVNACDKAVLRLQATASQTSVKLKWNEVPDADGYVIYRSKCGAKNGFKQVKVIERGKTLTWPHKNLKKNTWNKYYVKAYKVIDGKKTFINTSNRIHLVTKGGKHTNVKKLKSSVSGVTLSKGKTKALKIMQIYAEKNKNLVKHMRPLTYTTSDKTVATVTSKGVIKAKGTGSCYIYVTAHNGVYTRVKVTIK